MPGTRRETSVKATSFQSPSITSYNIQGACCRKYSRLRARISSSLSEDDSCSRANFGKIPECSSCSDASAKRVWKRVRDSSDKFSTHSVMMMASGGESGVTCRQHATQPLLQETGWPSLSVMRVPISATVLLSSNTTTARSTRRIVPCGNSISASIRPSGRFSWIGTLRVF